MCGNKCGKGGCAVMCTVKTLLIIGGLNWGLIGLGMLMDADWNVIGMILGDWPVVLAIVYLLVGVAAVAKLVGCRCAKCKAACASCEAKDTAGQNQTQM